jgi:carbon starvation protein
MTLVTIVLVSAVFLVLAYRLYGGWLARALRLGATRVTPAIELRDDVDYVPIERRFLLSQHFSAIAAAGPIVGPILAGLMFGWLPAIVWILLGCVLIGGVHDLTALVASIRHKARSIAEVVREHMSRRAYVLFLLFVWFALVYIIAAFTDVTASSFVGRIRLENGEEVLGGGIATSSLLYLALPVLMGLLLKFTKLPLWAATVIFLPLVAMAIWAGQSIPFDLTSLLGIQPGSATRVWDVALLVYCLVASIVPMWLLLQPRGHLGGYFLYIALLGGALGLILANEPIRYPAFIGWTSVRGEPLFPMLFIVIACGACSGFHSIVASGTTSKQLRTETDARAIGYGAMLLEGMVAVVSLCCVMRIASDSPITATAPNVVYANGLGSFLSRLGVPPAFAVSFALMAFTTFVYDTLDVCTRLGRYVIQELTGWHDWRGRFMATAITSAAPLLFIFSPPMHADGKELPVWRVFWNLFGASNQLLAALTLMGVTVWLWRTRRARWVWPVVGLPTLWMYTMSTWALVRLLKMHVQAQGFATNPVAWVAALLLVLAGIMLIEALRILIVPRSGPPAEPIPVAAAAA